MLDVTETAPEDMSIIEALLVGTDEPVEAEVDDLLGEIDDLTAAAIVTNDDSASSDVIDILAGEEEVDADYEPPVAKMDDDDVEGLFVAPTRAARPPRDPSLTKSRGEAFTDKVAMDRAREILGTLHDPVIEGMEAAPKKVGEKVYNVLCCIAGRGKLSKFTSIAYYALKNNGKLTSAELVELYKDYGYSVATARSQAQQQMTALPILLIASRHQSELTFEEDQMSRLLDAALMGAPAEPITPPEVEGDDDLLAAAPETDGVEEETATPGDPEGEETPAAEKRRKR